MSSPNAAEEDEWVLGTPRTTLHGAHRPSANPRIHAITKPYSRPSSYSGPRKSTSPVKLANGDASPSSRAAPTTRPPPDRLGASLSRSKSDASLLSGFRSMVSRGLTWLATPARESTAPGQRPIGAFEADVEDPESPSVRKRPRERTSERDGGDYRPKRLEMESRAGSGVMLPPLPPNVSLTPKSHLQRNVPNFSRPTSVPASKSMPYLDPPSGMLSPARRRGDSRVVPLPAARDHVSDLTQWTPGKGKAKEKAVEKSEAWSPWKDRRTPSAGPASRTSTRRTPGLSEAREVCHCLEIVTASADLTAHSPFYIPIPRSPVSNSLLSRNPTSSPTASFKSRLRCQYA